MSEQVLRVDPAKVHTTLKEAVVDALLNMTHAHVSGAGEYGKYLYGARPRTLLNSGFLLPQRNNASGDEVTSPIWISSHGLQLQIAAGIDGEIVIKPSLAVYARILPTEDDLMRPNCRLSFRLRREIFLAAREAIRNREDEVWDKIKEGYKSRYLHPDWARVREEIRTQVYTERGIPSDLSVLENEEPLSEEAALRPDEAAPEGIVLDGSVPPTVTIRDEDFDPLAIPHKWQRIDLQMPELRFDPSKGTSALADAIANHESQMNTSIAQQLRDWSASQEGQQWGYRHLPVRPSQYRHWSAFLESIRSSSEPIVVPEIQLGWNLQLAQDWLDTSGQNLLIALENRSAEPRQHVDDAEQAVFQVELEIHVPKNLHRSLKLERVEPSYRYNRYLQYAAMGHNGGVKAIASNDLVMTLRTTWAPRYVQPRIVPTEGNGINRHVRSLSTPGGFDTVVPIVEAMRKWLASVPNKVDLTEGIDPSDTPSIARETEKFQDDMQKWTSELSSIDAGIKVLQESRQAWSGRGAQQDPKGAVFEAWLAMNEAMANFMKRRFKNDQGEWRLFQLAFIIANIPAIASRMPDFRHYYDAARDDSVTLLYFATGGGKSEAFFGLLTYNLMLDRLRGKNTGVTAMVRYPLRLLTIQQAQRCAKVLAQAEIVRKAHGYAGDSFSIGFWVGSGGSPNNHRTKGVSNIKEVDETPPDQISEEKLRETDSKYRAAVHAWNKLPSCPFCNSMTALRRFPMLGGTLAHVCSRLDCPSNDGEWNPLPFYICDEDIYDFAPSVLLGTVDKLALIGHSSGTIRRIYGMLGAAPWRHPTNKRLKVPNKQELERGYLECGYEPLWPAYSSGKRLFHDPFPSMLIQDEAHLLDESLGTFAGLFESTLDSVLRELAKPLKDVIAYSPDHKRRRAKVIAASATVSDPERQLEHLYQRSIPASQFPHPGPTLYGSFYATPAEPDANERERSGDPDPEISSPQARVYCGFMTNGKPHTATSVAVLSSFHLCITRLFDGFVNGDKNSQQLLRASLQACISHGPLQSLHQQALANASISDLVTLIDLHRIALTYVTNKKGGDQIMAAEHEETRKRHLSAQLPLGNLDTRLITGSVDQGEIQEVVRVAQQRDEPGQSFTPLDKVLRSVIATSAISHGVDVEEFNSMFFAGMPSDIAEYIQASSRVGRTHIGFVVLVPTPQRRRDRYIVEVFDIFHRFLERMVQPAAIDRWAEKAVERVFPSLLQAFLVGTEPTRRLIELPDDQKANLEDFSWIPAIRKEYTQRGKAFADDIARFIEDAIGLRDGYCPDGEEHYRTMIGDKVHRILNLWATSALYGNGYLKAYFDGQTDTMNRPMTSLRDVDQGGEIRMSNKDAQGGRQKPNEVFAVMELVRNGVAEDDDGED